MILRFFITTCLLILPVWASADTALTRLYDLLEIDAYLAITRAEGIEDVDNLSMDMLGRSADGGLIGQMDRIYDHARMAATVRQHMQSVLDPEHVSAALIYFGSDAGQRIAKIELAARQAMSDLDVEDSARHTWELASETHPWLVARIEEIVETNDLLERNVSGALTSNLKFYQGLADGGALDIAEEQMVVDVWSQEAEIRNDTESWLGGYLMLAYEPLSEEDLSDYLRFWQTEAGRAVNAAVFEGFNRVYDDISYATGRVLALSMETQEL